MLTSARFYISVVLVAILSGPATAKPPASLDSTALISPMPVIEERTGRSAEALGDYMALLRDALISQLSTQSKLPNLRLAVVVAVKPGQLSRCWIEAGEPGIDPIIAEALKAACLGVKPPEVTGGPIAFSLNFKIKRGGKSPNFQGYPYPLPADWREALEKSEQGRIPDDALSTVWP